FDKNSFNSGDWFNKLDWTYQTNNFAVGLPQEEDNKNDWPTMDPFLINPAIKPGVDAIKSAHRYCAGIPLESHPILRNCIVDPVVKQSKYNALTGTFTIPPRTTA